MRVARATHDAMMKVRLYPDPPAHAKTPAPRHGFPVISEKNSAESCIRGVGTCVGGAAGYILLRPLGVMKTE